MPAFPATVLVGNVQYRPPWLIRDLDDRGNAARQRLQRDWLDKKFGRAEQRAVSDATLAGKADQHDDWHVRVRACSRRPHCLCESFAIHSHFPVENDDIGSYCPDDVEAGGPV